VAAEAGSNLDLALAEGHFWLGRALVAKGEMPAALTQLHKACDAEPRNALFRLHLGAAEEKAAQLAEAVESYQRSAELDPKQPDPLERLAGLYVNAGRYDLAAPVLEKAVQIAPRLSRLKLALADCRQRTGKGEAAVKLYREVMRDDPSAVQVYYRLARAIHEAQGLGAALPWYERAAKEERDNPMPHYYLGYASKERGQKARAIQEFKAYLAAKPDADDRKDIEREIEDLGGGP
jgi:tetratricopeptide (TPR) repeat protein